MERNCTGIKNQMKINDWTQIQSEFDELVKLVERSRKTMPSLPTFFLRTMVALEDFLAEKVKNRAEQKKMSKENSRALIRMKGKLKKQLELMRKDIDEFRINLLTRVKNPRASRATNHILELAANTAEAVMFEENQRLTQKIGDVLSLRSEFAPHMTSVQLNELLTQPFSQVLAGNLEVSTHNPMEAYVLVAKPHAIEKVLVFG
ncbi:hypothetical protein PsorP6_015489 [Peronosclerospora sorghi]|uniref:Uncharacterized protein n=1 Tax=Peronosclerospora sorghi TaxID=230839 RepID=A0ACC0WQP4_9STRA|nr:hypothetical protein PsorP6_015489 [Peronosclerospora sorghi]